MVTGRCARFPAAYDGDACGWDDATRAVRPMRASRDSRHSRRVTRLIRAPQTLNKRACARSPARRRRGPAPRRRASVIALEHAGVRHGAFVCVRACGCGCVRTDCERFSLRGDGGES